MDFSVLTSGTVGAAAGDSVRTLLVFNDENLLGEALDNAPTMNGHFGTDLPPMLSSRAFGIHRGRRRLSGPVRDAADVVPQGVFDDPAYKENLVIGRARPLGIRQLRRIDECAPVQDRHAGTSVNASRTT